MYESHFYQRCDKATSGAPCLNSISAIVISRNEEKNIGRCLASLAWADEVVVVDALSEDKTVEIINDKTAPWASKVRLLQKEWPGFREQRNFALQAAKHNWIFSIDSDEVCSPELAKKIQSLAQMPTDQKYFKVHRVEYFLGKPIRFGVWNPSYQDRFFFRPGVEYVNEIHEYPKYPGIPDRIHEPIYHYPDFTPEKFLYKMNFYTSIEARDRVRAGQRTHALRILTAGPAMFLKNYFYYRAYRDGYHGFIISILEGISRAVRHIKIWQYQRELEKS